MSDKELSRKWALAKQKLEKEFDIPSRRLHLIDTIKSLFEKYVSEHELSEQAAIALYFRLAFFSILLTVRTLNKMDMQVPGFRLKDILPIYTESKRLSAEADDCLVLEQCIENISDTLESMIQEYIN